MLNAYDRNRNLLHVGDNVILNGTCKLLTIKKIDDDNIPISKIRATKCISCCNDDALYSPQDLILLR
ncbi:putative selenium delivery protein YdfZ [Hafnia alvei]|uniref:putative selenium delivery protein YdfZ n=1 Tax=Hafnia alvei TaxID=569 RepID=UPI000930E94A|nr:putative selenium delivery protein YdfZ [Hafnia alvei]NLS55221.1 selenium-binding protein [Hafnia alvei]